MGEKVDRKTKARVGAGDHLLIRVVDRLLPLLVVATALCLLRLLFGAITKEFSSFPLTPQGVKMTPAEQEAMRGGVIFTTRLFAVLLWATALLCFVRFHEEDTLALLFGGVGALLAFALPWLLQGDGPAERSHDLLALTTWSLAMTGRLLLAVSLLRFGVGVGWRAFVSKPQARRKTLIMQRPVFTKGSAPPRREDLLEAKKRKSLFRHCWELSQCRGTLRLKCPNFRDQQDCWRRGSGCQCDPQLARGLVEQLDLEISNASSDQERRAAERMKSAVVFRSTREAGSRDICRKCELFNEHQAHKFKALYWIAYPVAVVITAALLPLIHRGYLWAYEATDRIFGAMQLLPNNKEAFAPFVTPGADYSLEPLVVFSLGLIIVSYLIDTMDYIIFEVKV